MSVRGSLDDVQRAHDSLLAYVHAAVRAPSQPALLSSSGRVAMTECITTPASCEPRPTAAFLGAGVSPASPPLMNSPSAASSSPFTSQPDERNGLGSEPAGTYPPVKLGGLAASQYSTVGAHSGSQRRAAPLPGPTGPAPSPREAVAGEHGFRFFPAYYLHIWDMFQRIPVYQPRRRQRQDLLGSDPAHCLRQRPAGDHPGLVGRWQPVLVFPRELPRPAPPSSSDRQPACGSGLHTRDSRPCRAGCSATSSPVLCVVHRNCRTCPPTTSSSVTTPRPGPTGSPTRPSSTRSCAKCQGSSPLSTRTGGDARTNITTYLQLYLNMKEPDSKCDGVLNGPTTESWFDHWYRHLLALGVRFVRNKVTRLDAPAFDPSQPPHLRPRVQITFADGTRVAPDYTVAAADAPAAETITCRAARCGHRRHGTQPGRFHHFRSPARRPAAARRDAAPAAAGSLHGG